MQVLWKWKVYDEVWFVLFQRVLHLQHNHPEQSGVAILDEYKT